jgi:hypothetical protein
MRTEDAFDALTESAARRPDSPREPIDSERDAGNLPLVVAPMTGELRRGRGGRRAGVRSRRGRQVAAVHGPVSILLVDDHAENLLALSAILDAPGRELVQAASGREALGALRQRDFAVILVDINMPGMDGFEFASRIRQRLASAPTPIIFITAESDETHRLRAYALGAVDYILAPIRPEIVRAKVAVFVELHRKTAENRRQAEQLRQAEEQLRRRAEAQLRETHARLQQVIDSVADYAIFSLDASGRIATWNAGAARLFLYEETEALGRDVAMLLEHPHLSVAQRQRAAAEGRAEIDAWFLRKDGTRFYGNDVVTPLAGPGGSLTGFSKVTRDITDRRRAEEAMRQQANELADANRLKDEFLAILSHELRTPLNAIIGWAHVLLDRPVDAQTARRGIEAIARNGRAQLDLVNDILDVSRFVTGKFRMEMAPLDLRTVADAAFETGQTAAHAKGILLEHQAVSSGVPVNGDAARLQQVVWNLVSNAVKFTRQGGRVRLEIGAAGPFAWLRVQDNGAGIPADFLPHVFDRFRQGDSSTSRSAGGLGLGLAIVKHIVELHGGTVSAESAGTGRGATFTVRLPLAAALHPAPSAVPPAPGPTVPRTAESIRSMLPAEGEEDPPMPSPSPLMPHERPVVPRL